jgi:hypothetical protein
MPLDVRERQIFANTTWLSQSHTVPADDSPGCGGPKVITLYNAGSQTTAAQLLKLQLPKLKAACWLMLLLSANAALCASEKTLSSDTQLSTEGYFVLSWQSGDSEDQIWLQESGSADFSNTTDTAITATGSITLTGYADGDYHFRVGHPGNWSSPLLVTVQHHALGRALAFFSLGLLLFMVLVVAILRGRKLQGGQQH